MHLLADLLLSVTQTGKDVKHSEPNTQYETVQLPLIADIVSSYCMLLQVHLQS